MRKEDASDIFQSVFAELLQHLPELRNAESLRSWLITVTTHKCDRWQRRSPVDVLPLDAVPEPADTGEPIDIVLDRLDRADQVRYALTCLPRRCQQLVRLLFFEQPPRPYREIAQQLGLATGSIGFIRGRCLQRLERILLDMGL